MHAFLRKSFILSLTAILSVIFLSACSGKSKEISVDTAKLAKELSEQAVTSEQLTQTADTMVATGYYIGEDIYAGGAAYKGSGATACEVAVIECKKADQTAEVEKLFKQHVESQSSLYADYNPGEVEKLDKAVIKSAGKYTVLCICDDTEKAQSILKNYGL